MGYVGGMLGYTRIIFGFRIGFKVSTSPLPVRSSSGGLGSNGFRDEAAFRGIRVRGLGRV